MTKNEFLNILQKNLMNMSENERHHYTEYYSEIIDDSIEDGMSEQEAVASLGNIDGIMEQINTSGSVATSAKHRISVFGVIIFICASPIWLSFFGIYIAIWAVLAALYAADFAMAISGLAGMAAFLFILSNPASAFAVLGYSIFSVGLSIIACIGLNRLDFYFIRFTKWIFRSLKNFLTKEET